MREETGALAPPSADVHKMKHSKKHGIMASVFSGNPGCAANSEMNLELSMEINSKMQAVLEDTLLKNITLKASGQLLCYLKRIKFVCLKKDKKSCLENFNE